MSRFVYDVSLPGFTAADGATFTVHAVGTGYVPDPTHTVIGDIDSGQILGSETTTITVTVTDNVLSVTCTDGEVDVDPIDEVTVQGFAWTVNNGSDDQLVFWHGLDTPTTATEPQTVQFPTGLATLSGGYE